MHCVETYHYYFEPNNELTISRSHILYTITTPSAKNQNLVFYSQNHMRIATLTKKNTLEFLSRVKKREEIVAEHYSRVCGTSGSHVYLCFSTHRYIWKRHTSDPLRSLPLLLSIFPSYYKYIFCMNPRTMIMCSCSLYFFFF